jgi:arsenite-transporting ATPase
MLPFRPLDAPSPFIFFTGKGGVGKTSLACATAVGLADRGRRVLLVSTDPASNLDEMLGTPLSSEPAPVAGVERLFALNIDPEAAAEAYRARVLAQLDPAAGADERRTVREQLSGACTTEIAAFDEFVGLLAGDVTGFDTIVFDTAPTGHTLRLLSLPKAWTGFLESNERGASCLGPHSGLKMQEARFRRGLEALGDAARTSIVLVTRPDAGAIREAARTSAELASLGLANQTLVVNGRFRAADRADAVASAIEREQDAALDGMPAALSALPRDEVPLVPYDTVGLPAIRSLFAGPAAEPSPAAEPDAGAADAPPLPLLCGLADALAARGRGLIMVMGKGGVGKTTVAAALALGLAARGHTVHLTTTDPAAHLNSLFEGTVPNLTVDRIDPRVETAKYIAKVMSTRGKDLDEPARALLREDLASPCTEEVAVFHAFSRVVAEARSAFVVVDTAPTGHTLLLLDATGAYHRQMTRTLEPSAPGRILTPLMRLQDPDYTSVILVTLPETTPVSEAAALQEDLRRADIEPYAWVINRSLAGTDTADRILRATARRERRQFDRVLALASRAYIVPLMPIPPRDIASLQSITLPA